MQMWNMVIVGGNNQAARGDGGGAPTTAINSTHGLPVGDWQPGMRGHVQNPQAGIESGVGPSYAHATPYTVTNTQNIVAAILKNSSREDSYPLQGAGGGTKLNTMAPAGSAKQITPEVVDQSANGPTNVTVGSGQAKKTVTTAALAGSSESSGGKSAAEVIVAAMQNAQTPAKTAYEDYTQMALQSDPAVTNPQSVRSNTRNSNKANGRKAVGGANQSQGYNPHSPSPQQTSGGYSQGASTKSASTGYGGRN